MFRVYYTDPLTGWARGHDVTTINDALRVAEDFRRLGMIFVTMVSENPNSVGRPGVDSVVDGKTPDGVPYTWNKAGRIGRTKRTRGA